LDNIINYPSGSPLLITELNLGMGGEAKKGRKKGNVYGLV
jgi:hypothetical protein